MKENEIKLNGKMFKINNEVKTFFQLEAADENFETKVTVDNSSCYLSYDELQNLYYYIQTQLQIIKEKQGNQNQLNLF